MYYICVYISIHSIVWTIHCILYYKWQSWLYIAISLARGTTLIPCAKQTIHKCTHMIIQNYSPKKTPACAFKIPMKNNHYILTFVLWKTLELKAELHCSECGLYPSQETVSPKEQPAWAEQTASILPTTLQTLGSWHWRDQEALFS